MVRSETLKTMLMARLAGHVINRRQVDLGTVMLAVASSTRHIAPLTRRGLIADFRDDLTMRRTRVRKTRQNIRWQIVRCDRRLCRNRFRMAIHAQLRLRGLVVARDHKR
jgi:hypothetical protein